MGAVMQATWNRIFGLAAIVLLAGCSSLTDREVDYQAGAVKAPPLEVPPPLTKPETEKRFTIPGDNGKQAANHPEYSSQELEQPWTAPAAKQQPKLKTKPKQMARLLKSKGITYILLNESFGRSWRKVGLALDNARLTITDKDRNKGIYFVTATSAKDKKEHDYRVVVRKSGARSKVTIVDQNGKTDEETKRLTRLVYSNLDK